MSFSALTNIGNTNVGFGPANYPSGFLNLGYSPTLNGSNQPFRQSLISGCTKLSLVPFNLQNLSIYDSIDLRGISALTEIYPFSGWTNLRYFSISQTKIKDFSISIPENFDNCFIFEKNDSNFEFTPRYHNPTLKNLAFANFQYNTSLSSLTLDFSKKNVYSLRIMSNPNLLDVYLTLNTGQTLNNNNNLQIISNSSLTGITFFPNNKNALSGVNIAFDQVSYNNADPRSCASPFNMTWSNYNRNLGGFHIGNNPNLKKFNYNLPPVPNRYFADLSYNGLTSFDDDFLYDGPWQLYLNDNSITGISSSFKNWPQTIVKKFPTAITRSDYCTYRPNASIKPTNLLPSDYILYSGSVTSVTVNCPLIIFNMDINNNFPTLPLAVSYRWPQGVEWGGSPPINMAIAGQKSYVPKGTGFLSAFSGWSSPIDDMRPMGCVNFNCDDDSDDFNQMKGMWAYGLGYSGCTAGYGCNIFYAQSPWLKNNGTFYPTNGILYLSSQNYLNLSDNSLVDLLDTNGNIISDLPNGLQLVEFNDNSFTGFSANLNKHLREFQIKSIKGGNQIKQWNGEVSASTELSYFDVYNIGLTGWTKYFYTGLTNSSFFRQLIWYPYYSPIIGRTGQTQNSRVLVGASCNLSRDLLTAMWRTPWYSPTNNYTYVNAHNQDDVRYIHQRTFNAAYNKFTTLDFKYFKIFTDFQLHFNPLSGLTNLSNHDKVYHLRLDNCNFTNSSQIIGDNEPWPPLLKYLALIKNNALPNDGIFLTSWTKSFSGLSSNPFTGTSWVNEYDYSGEFSDYENTIEKRWGKGPLILDFRGQYLLSGTSGFDFIVRDLVTARTNGVYLSGGCLLVSSITGTTSKSNPTPQFNYIVRNTISTGPTPYTGFTLNDGTEFEVSPTGDMYAWLNILTGQTIGETTGRGWFTELSGSLTNKKDYGALPEQIVLSEGKVPGNYTSFFNFYT